MTIHSVIGLREKIGLCMETFMAVAKSCVEKFIRLDARLHTWNRPPPPHPKTHKTTPTLSKMEIVYHTPYEYPAIHTLNINSTVLVHVVSI